MEQKTPVTGSLIQMFKAYTPALFRKDFNAGLNVALLAFPQGMAFALIAGVPIQYGIYGTAIAAILGSLFSGGRFISLGPTNATAVMLMGAFISMAATQEQILVMMPVLLLMVGVFLIAAYLIKAANLIQYVSASVVTGYITAAALLIISNQLKNVFGFQFDETATTFFAIVQQTMEDIGKTQWTSLALGLVTALVFFFLRRKLKTWPNVAITLLLMSLLGYVLNYYVDPSLQVATFSSFSAGDWKLTLPSFSFDLIGQLGSIAMALSFLSVLEGISIGKSLAARSGETIDPNQEMLSIGIANIGCALFSGMPASGSLTRSTLNWTSHAATPLSHMVNGVLCLLGALLLGPYIHFIPKPSLAVLVIFLGFSLVHFRRIRVLLNTTRDDRIVFIVTVVAALVLRLDTTIFLGTGLSLILFLRKAAKPKLVEYVIGDQGQLQEIGDDQERAHPQVMIVHVEGNLFFGAAELFRNQMRLICMDPNLTVVILKMRNALHFDATAALALEELIRYMKDHKRHLLISEIRPEVYDIFKASGIMDVVEESNIFMDNRENSMISTAQAAKRAKEIIGDVESKVRIWSS